MLTNSNFKCSVAKMPETDEDFFYKAIFLLPQFVQMAFKIMEVQRDGS